MQETYDLKQLLQQLSQLEPLERELEQLYEQRRLCDREVISRRVACQMEQEEGMKLEARSIVNFFLKITGKLGEKRLQARQRLQQAQESLSAAEAEIEQLVNRIRQLCARQAELYAMKKRYQQLLAEKRREMKESGTEAGNRILALEQRIAEIENQRRELREASSAGNRAKGTARRILKELKGADDWNTWDLVGGDGLITHMAKHSHLDEAQDLLQELREELKCFRTELADVHIGTTVQVNTDGFLRFADWFFDGLLVDLTMRDRIRQAQMSVSGTVGSLERTLEKLSQMERSLSLELSAREAELEQLVLNG